jgi:hypothetical protein
MVRLQVQLEAAQHRQVKRRASRLGISVAEVIRRCVTDQLKADEAEGPEAHVRRALAAAGRYADAGASPSPRVANEHDAALADAYRR